MGSWAVVVTMAGVEADMLAQYCGVDLEDTRQEQDD